MPVTDPRVDAYIERSAPFAQPILRHLRQVVHDACPDVEETIKWGFPNFTRGGLILCHMASFRQHCAFGFWQGSRIVEDAAERENAMGQFGRVTGVDDLPAADVLAGYGRRAAELREEEAAAKRGGKKGSAASAPTKRAPRPELPVPEQVARALDADARARATFDAFPPSHRREYVEWINEAKTDATRERRIAQMLEWLAEGKPRNWKYMKR